ncbi:class I SAM-dependent methyltransferase [Agromyces mediolanus]|uniref:class I SAM-dependent methyltransferase n=1 Tax=Agromyces mediolanus TaxID=41986 RepID=UPI00203CF1FD|nr:class I SAM-dependent methyltransferase [Agromyces mediolanus]MCM3657651.1 class I SAM-dependent methyltransferase [Agromyces mediolanus]
MTVEAVSAAYGARSAEYVERFGGIDAAADADRRALLAWASGVTGPALDVGCGPGQWTAFLARHGLDIEGVDPTPEFVAAARLRHPTERFRLGRAEELGVDDASLGGILAWFSLIHTPPDAIDLALEEFARALAPAGSLALGFFEGPERESFPHAVTTAYFWPLDELTARVEGVGFTITDAQARTDPGVRRQGLILARRAAPSRRGA